MNMWTAVDTILVSCPNLQHPTFTSLTHGCISGAFLSGRTGGMPFMGCGRPAMLASRAWIWACSSPARFALSFASSANFCDCSEHEHVLYLMFLLQMVRIWSKEELTYYFHSTSCLLSCFIGKQTDNYSAFDDILICINRTPSFTLLVTISDNFSFQNNGIKKCTCWKTMGFSGKQWFFWENNVLFF